MTTPDSPSLTDAAAAVELAQNLVDKACAAVTAQGGIDANQVVAYDVAHAAAAVATARATLEYGAHGADEANSPIDVDSAAQDPVRKVVPPGYPAEHGIHCIGIRHVFW